MASTLDSATDRLLFPAGPAAARVHGDVAPRGARLWRALRVTGDAALDLLYPPHCVSCQVALPPETNKALCRDCAMQIHWIGLDRCARCGDGVGLGSGVVGDCPSCRSHPPAFVSASCALAKYSEGPLRNLVLALKFSAKFHVARVLGDALARRIQAVQLSTAKMVVVPTPLTRKAAWRRGFNQAEELAICVSQRLGLRMETGLLTKIRSTPTQATLSPEKRRLNLKGAFACDAKRAARYKDTCVLLIDDVITTGSTVSECARMLSDAGIGEVRAAAVARG